jgi:transposase
MPAGRPTQYDPKYAEQAYVACAEMGASDLKLAKLFGVSKATITNWKRDHDEFLASIKKGREEWDNAEIEKSLGVRARGYKFTETTKEARTDPETGETKLVTTKKVTKQVPPDTTACIYWLNNRQPDRWRNVKQVEVSGKDGEPMQHNHEHKVDLTPKQESVLSAILGDNEQYKDDDDQQS